MLPKRSATLTRKPDHDHSIISSTSNNVNSIIKFGENWLKPEGIVAVQNLRLTKCRNFYRKGQNMTLKNIRIWPNTHKSLKGH